MFTRQSFAVAFVAFSAASFSGVAAFDPTCNSNLVAYWGQNTFGAANPNDPAGWQQNLGSYCDDDTVDTFPIAFLDTFQDIGGLPSYDISNACSVAGGNSVFPGSNLLDCSFLAADIQKCQAKGKTVTISIGGEFSSGTPSPAFADQIWDLFLGGSSTTRPFGDAVLDGVDLDIEQGSNSFVPFVTQLRSHMDAATDKTYYITGAPQCPFPDQALGATLNAVGFDAVYVQFYNNNCGLQTFGTPAFDMATWDNWAQTMSPNKEVKVYIGAPASSQSAGSGYVDVSTLTSVVQNARQFPSFGGVMLWDISTAVANDNYHSAIKSALTNGGSCGASNAARAIPTSETSTTATATPTERRRSFRFARKELE